MAITPSAAYLGVLAPGSAVVSVASLAMFVDKLDVGGIVVVSVVVALGAGSILYGLTLTAREHAKRPQLGEEGYIGLWSAHHLPLRVARVWRVVFGAAWLALVAVVLRANWPHRSRPNLARRSASPRRRHFGTHRRQGRGLSYPGPSPRSIGAPRRSAAGGAPCGAPVRDRCASPGTASFGRRNTTEADSPAAVDSLRIG
jgi:hypothetical protein